MELHKKASFALCALLFLAGTNLTHAGDREEVLAVIDQYMEYEQAGHMLAQGGLMTDHRAMVYAGGRLTGETGKLMQEQQEEQDKFAAEFPGVRYKIELRDVRLEIWNGDSALVTFDSFPTRIVPPSLPAEKVAKLGPAKTPLIVAAMLVKQAGTWKIALTTFVPR